MKKISTKMRKYKKYEIIIMPDKYMLLFYNFIYENNENLLSMENTYNYTVIDFILHKRYRKILKFRFHTKLKTYLKS